MPERDYVDALLQDLHRDRVLVEGRELSAVFIGGGTPSLFSPLAIDRLLQGVSECLPIEKRAEITLEANPGALDRRHFPGYLAAGINRLSIGAQTFDDELLRALGRIHSSEEALSAYHGARAAGFGNINLDLMFGLPGQDEAGAVMDLELGLGLEPEHLSWYQLTIEPNTLFYHQPPDVPAEEALWVMQQAGQKLIADMGYQQYEISGYAREGYRCRHNLNYWQFGDYLGLGAGAHAKLTTSEGVLRYSKQRQPDRYMQTAGTKKCYSSYRWLQADDLRLEFMLNAMRLRKGVPKKFFSQRTGLSLDQLMKPMELALERGLIAPDDNRLRPTELGQLFLNDLLLLFE